MGIYTSLVVENIIQERHENAKETSLSLEEFKSKYGQKLLDDMQNILNEEENESDVLEKINQLFKKTREERREDVNFDISDFTDHMGNILQHILMALYKTQ